MMCLKLTAWSEAHVIVAIEYTNTFHFSSPPGSIVCVRVLARVVLGARAVGGADAPAGGEHAGERVVVVVVVGVGDGCDGGGGIGGGAAPASISGVPASDTAVAVCIVCTVHTAIVLGDDHRV